MRKELSKRLVYAYPNGTIFQVQFTGRDWNDNHFNSIQKHVCFRDSLIKLEEDGNLNFSYYLNVEEMNMKGFEYTVTDCGDGIYKIPTGECQCNLKETAAATREQNFKIEAFDFITQHTGFLTPLGEDYYKHIKNFIKENE